MTREIGVIALTVVLLLILASQPPLTVSAVPAHIKDTTQTEKVVKVKVEYIPMVTRLNLLDSLHDVQNQLDSVRDITQYKLYVLKKQQKRISLQRHKLYN